jgi:hypothetical protein
LDRWSDETLTVLYRFDPPKNPKEMAQLFEEEEDEEDFHFNLFGDGENGDEDWTQEDLANLDPEILNSPMFKSLLAEAKGKGSGQLSQPFQIAGGLEDSTGGFVSRNALCSCGSGKRFKFCHGQINARPSHAFSLEEKGSPDKDSQSVAKGKTSGFEKKGMSRREDISRSRSKTAKISRGKDLIPSAKQGGAKEVGKIKQGSFEKETKEFLGAQGGSKGSKGAFSSGSSFGNDQNTNPKQSFKKSYAAGSQSQRTPQGPEGRLDHKKEKRNVQGASGHSGLEPKIQTFRHTIRRGDGLQGATDAGASLGSASKPFEKSLGNNPRKDPARNSLRAVRPDETSRGAKGPPNRSKAKSFKKNSPKKTSS